MNSWEYSSNNKKQANCCQKNYKVSQWSAFCVCAQLFLLAWTKSHGTVFHFSSLAFRLLSSETQKCFFVKKSDVLEARNQCWSFYFKSFRKSVFSYFLSKRFEAFYDQAQNWKISAGFFDGISLFFWNSAWNLKNSSKNNSPNFFQFLAWYQSLSKCFFKKSADTNFQKGYKLKDQHWFLASKESL